MQSAIELVVIQSQEARKFLEVDNSCRRDFHEQCSDAPIFPLQARFSLIRHVRVHTLLAKNSNRLPSLSPSMFSINASELIRKSYSASNSLQNCHGEWCSGMVKGKRNATEARAKQWLGSYLSRLLSAPPSPSS